MRFLAIVGAFLTLSISVAACAPSMEAVANLPVGPKPQNAQGQATAFVKNLLKDPYSAHFDQISPARVSTCSYFGPWRGWYVQLSVNAKNSFGGYTGSSTYYVWFRNGHAVAAVENLLFCPQGNML